MKTLLRCLTLLVCALPALAQDPLALRLQSKLIQQTPGNTSLNLQPKGLALSSSGTGGSVGSIDGSVPPGMAVASAALDREPIPGSCSVSGGALCYDYKTGRAVFKPMRELMPEISGLRPENITVHRDSITLHYSFK